MISDTLMTDIYFSIRSHAGWLADLVEAGYSEKEVEFFEKLDIELMDYQPEQEADKWALEVEKAGGHDVISLESDDERMELISKKIADYYREMENLLRGAWSYVEVVIRRKEIKRLEKIRFGFRARKLHTSGDGELTEHEIVKAREFPLEVLICLEKNPPYIVCPWHDDSKPSMLVKNGYGYCFSCGAWADSIKWLMEIDKYNFKDAVRRLSR